MKIFINFVIGTSKQNSCKYSLKLIIPINNKMRLSFPKLRIWGLINKFQQLNTHFVANP